MPQLTIHQDTFFKKSTAQRSNLGTTDTFAVKAGQTFEAVYAYPVAGHYLVKLKDRLGTVGKLGYFYMPTIQVQSEEIRGVWLTNVDSEVLNSLGNLKEGLKRLKAMGFNTLYPAVWQRGFTLYPSGVAKALTGAAVMPNSVFEHRDMLAELIQVAKPMGFRVIPWFEYGLMVKPGSPIDLQTRTGRRFGLRAPMVNPIRTFG
jgi:Glycosyl hydrolase-like 10